MKAYTCTRGKRTGRISSPNTVDKISSPAALHFRKFQEFMISSFSYREEISNENTKNWEILLEIEFKRAEEKYLSWNWTITCRNLLSLFFWVTRNKKSSFHNFYRLKIKRNFILSPDFKYLFRTHQIISSWELTPGMKELASIDKLHFKNTTSSSSAPLTPWKRDWWNLGLISCLVFRTIIATS